MLVAEGMFFCFRCLVAEVMTFRTFFLFHLPAAQTFYARVLRSCVVLGLELYEATCSIQATCKSA